MAACVDSSASWSAPPCSPVVQRRSTQRRARPWSHRWAGTRGTPASRCRNGPSRRPSTRWCRRACATRATDTSTSTPDGRPPPATPTANCAPIPTGSPTASPTWRSTPTITACTWASITARSTRAAVRTRASGQRVTNACDAQTFADWGVDYLKYDWCRAGADHTEQVRDFTAMRDALRATGRRIFYSINPNSSGDPGAGARYDWSGIADMSRNSIDVVPAWGDGALWAEGLVRYRAGPGHVSSVGAAQHSVTRQRSGHDGGWRGLERVRGRSPHHVTGSGTARPHRRRAAGALLAVGDPGRPATGGQRRPVDDPADPRHPDQPRRHRRRPGFACRARTSAAVRSRDHRQAAVRRVGRRGDDQRRRHRRQDRDHRRCGRVGAARVLPRPRSVDRTPKPRAPLPSDRWTSRRTAWR